MLQLLLLAATLGAEPVPTNWPGFRGDGTSTTTAKNLPVEWSPTTNIAWRLPLMGYGQSAPVVWGDLVFITAIEGAEKDKGLVLACQLTTGKLAWWHSFKTSAQGKNNPMMSRAAPTPVVDADGIYVFVETGDVLALGHTGKVKWQRALVPEYGAFKNNHGLGSSLTQTADTVFVLVDDMNASYLLALDKATGKNRWKTERPKKTAWTSPVVARHDGRDILVVSSSGSVHLYEATTGKQLAVYDGLVGNNIPSPVVVDSKVIIGAGENRMKPDRQASAQSNCCLELTTHATQTNLEPRWRGKKALTHHASPLVHRGHVYFVDKNGVVCCVDLATGAERYTERLDNPCWATPIGAGDYVYFFGKEGITTVLRAGPKYERVASNRLWSATTYAERQATAKATANLPPAPEGKGPGGGAPLPKEELEATRYSAVGDVVYGVAAVEGVFLLRTGTELIAVRRDK